MLCIVYIVHTPSISLSWVKYLYQEILWQSKHLWPQLLWFIIHLIWLKKEIYHKNYGAKQGFPALRKAVTTHMKKYCTFSCVFDIANQLLTCHSSFPPLNQVDEWMAKPSPFSIQGHLSQYFRILAPKTLKNSYPLQTAMFKLS